MQLGRFPNLPELDVRKMHGEQLEENSWKYQHCVKYYNKMIRDWLFYQDLSN